MDKEIEKILNELQICPSWAGYNFLIDAIKIKYDNYINLSALYEIISEKYNVKTQSVARTIRYCSQKNQKIIQDYFNINYKVNNNILISLIIRKLKLNMEESK